MRQHGMHRYRSTEGTLSILGISFNPAAGTWSTFSEDTKVILSEYTTEGGFHADCRRYKAAALRLIKRSLITHAKNCPKRDRFNERRIAAIHSEKQQFKKLAWPIVALPAIQSLK